jgi:ferrous iron transport protein A
MSSMLSLAEGAVSTPVIIGVAMRLDEIADGSAAIVRRLALPRGTARRLLEMGLLPGTRLRVVRRAPLGDPIELRLRNYSLSIRREEAALIEVEPAV